MRNGNLILLLTLFCLPSFSQKKKFTLEITFVQPWCGGAAPGEEMARESAQPKPYGNKTIIIVSEKGKVDSARTNERGELKLRLKKGVYKLMEPWRYYLDTPNGIDANEFDLTCLKEEWAKTAYLIEVGKKETKSQPQQQIIKHCSYNLPCLKEREVPPGR